MKRFSIVFAAAITACGQRHESASDAPVSSAPSAVSSAAAAPTSSAVIPPARSIVATAWITDVYDRPATSARTVGALRVGGVVPVLEGPIPGGGCAAGFFRIGTDAYVCGANATENRDDEIARAERAPPDRSKPLPYLYGVVRKPGPVYARLPTKAEMEATEPGLAEQMATWLAATDETSAAFRSDYWLRGSDQTITPADAWAQGTTSGVPDFLASNGKLSTRLIGAIHRENEGESPLVLRRTKRHNGFAIAETFLFAGRRFGLTPDLELHPIDRLRPIEGSRFHGVRIPEDAHLPLAFVRREGAFAVRFDGDKTKRDKDVPRRTVLELTGKERHVGERVYYEVDDGTWVSDQYASRLDPAKKMPKWGKKGERWLDVNVTKQTLVAYDGTQPIYATLVSTGEAGLGDPETSRATKRGIFRVHTKHVAATMDSDVVGEEFELRDIPYVQYFEGGYALHAAFWHDDFGTPRSHGCINLAPEDARFLFDFTRPEVPAGWHTARSALRGSVVFVHPLFRRGDRYFTPYAGRRRTPARQGFHP